MAGFFSAGRSLLRSAIAAALIQWAGPVTAQVVGPRLWATNGTVFSVVPDGKTIYIGGAFTRVGPATGGGAVLESASGALAQPSPPVTGTVYATASDGAGGWYIGGLFTAVGGLPRSNLAHVLADGSVDGWDPGANSTVLALAVSGSTVYAGGRFTSIAGQARNYLAALDAGSGAATAWNPNAGDALDPLVSALAVSGSTVYVGGRFGFIGGQARNYLAALDAASGTTTAWNPNPNGSITALALSGSTVYVGGRFGIIGGQLRNYLAALDAGSGAATAWDPSPNEGVLALAVSGSTVCAGGRFTSIGGQARNYLAALDAGSGAATAWNPNPNDEVHALAVSGSTVYAGGRFRSIDGQARNYLAALDATSGAASPWNPNPGNEVNALEVSGSKVYAGGDFTMVGGVVRNCIAALDATTGAATAWDPNATGAFGNAYVSALAVSGGTVYAGGTFTSIGGQARNCIAALDAVSGAATAWDPNAIGNGPDVLALAVNGSTIYVGGDFTNIGGLARNHIAALDAGSGAATSWDPNAGGTGYPSVYALAVSGSTVYVGGSFTTIGGQPRHHVAALDATTGAATAWDPNADSRVSSLAVSGSTVYVGGYFTNIGGQARNHIAGLDAVSGASTPWDPNAGTGMDLSVFALVVGGNTVYAGGNFSAIGGESRYGLAALNATSGAATAWNPNANGGVSALAVSGSTVYAGGSFTAIDNLPQSSIAAMGDASTPTLVSLVSASADPDRVRLTWFAPRDRTLAATLYRSTGGQEWRVLDRVSADAAGYIVYEDTQVIAGARYGYRLGVMEGGREELLGEAWVEVPRARALRLMGARPNPAFRDLTVAFSLPDASAARLELLDPAGRVVVSRDVGALGPGKHVINLAQGGTLAAGVYLLRLQVGRRVLSVRAVMVR